LIDGRMMGVGMREAGVVRLLFGIFFRRGEGGSLRR